MAGRPVSGAEWVECVCGGLIQETLLPPDIAEASGRTSLWTHDFGSIYCYSGDQMATAEPYS